MAIDESAGVKHRRDRAFRTPAQSFAMAVMFTNGSAGPCGASLPMATLEALERRGYAESYHVAGSLYRRRWRLTDEGRRMAKASPAVASWVEGWREAGVFDGPKP